MQYAIVTDLDKCVGCLVCSVACKVVNTVPIGQFWNKVLRVGPNPIEDGDQYPNVELYYLTLQCQHCENPQCVSVCPTGASQKAADGSVQVDKAKCIGCQFCVMSCPYSVRYLNEEERVVEKCTLCEQLISEGGLPQCVSQCSGRARYFGDIDSQALSEFRGPDMNMGDNDLQPTTLASECEDFSDAHVHALPDVGNKPTFRYILRKMKWRG